MGTMQWKRLIAAGFFVWAIPFIVAMFIFPIRTSNRPLFESIMPVAIVVAVTMASVWYFRTTTTSPLSHHLAVSMVWIVESLLIDALLFSRGPMAMSVSAYLSDIGVTYLMIIPIVVGVGWFRGRSHS